MTICKLCKKEKKLIGRAHIIPDFLYKYSGLYDEKHRLRHFSIQDLIDGKQPSLPQSGVHEGGILCEGCDNKVLGINLEYYAKKAIYGGGTLPKSECPESINYQNKDGNIFSICSNLNYTKYKLFLLSILWRASVSSKTFFKLINVGEHEEILRKMIYENNAKNYYEYPIFVATSASDNQFIANMIVEPRQSIDKDGMETCCFIIGGFIYIFKLGTFVGDFEELRTQTINEQNELTVLQMKEGQTIELLKNYMGL